MLLRRCWRSSVRIATGPCRCLSSSTSSASAPTPSFASTHSQRCWNKREGESRVELVSVRGTASPSTRGHNDLLDGKGEAISLKQSTPADHYSTHAYRARLTNGSYVSLWELARAVYAPAPLDVLTDLLNLASGQRGHDVAPLFNSAGQPLSSSASQKDAAQCSARRALARACDVHRLLQSAVVEAKDIVLAAENLGDAASHAYMESLLVQVDALANAVDSCTVRPEPATRPALPHAEDMQGRPRDAMGSYRDAGIAVGGGQWAVPPYTHAALLHGFLELAAAVGARLQAVMALETLIALGERQQRASSALRTAAGDGVGEGEDFTLDDVVALVEAEAQQHVELVGARDHICAMEACAGEHQRDFRTALSLYRRFVRHIEAGCFRATAQEASAALIALARSSANTTDFVELRLLLVESEVAATVPVSVPLYTALIDAASRAVEEPQRMAIALSLYRRLRDGGLRPTADTYAALIACCASTREPTHAFAFYHEARQVCGVTRFSPHVYTNLLLSYTTAGYGADARKTLDVLVEAGAPLSRSSFHAVLAGAVTVREAQEILHMMTEQYRLPPTPHTYSYLVQAVAKAPEGVSTALQLFDIHEDALRAVASLSSVSTEVSQRVGSDGKPCIAHGGTALSTSAEGAALEPMLLERFPRYGRALEHALVRLRVDLTQDPRLKQYLTPLFRLAQRRMNDFTGMPPQSPTRIPDKARVCVAVLAADVLANIDEWVMPFIAHYSVLVIPYSALVSMQCGHGRRIEGAMPRGAQAGLYDAAWQETPGGVERDAVQEHRRRRLVRFLKDYRDVIHLVSLEEELQWSRDTRRYGVGASDLFARASATALHLARQDEVYHYNDGSSAATASAGTSVYARHSQVSIVLVSADFPHCGRYIVDLKKAYGDSGKAEQMVAREGKGSPGLHAVLRRVSYHNPRTNPNWTPPSLAIIPAVPRHSSNDGEDTAVGE